MKIDEKALLHEPVFHLRFIQADRQGRLSQVPKSPITGAMSTERYLRPDWVTRHVLNPIVAGLMRIGISVRGSRILAVRGRRTGEWHTTPVNLLALDGRRYLVSPRGVTQWVRNVRAGGDVELRLGSRREAPTLVELDDADPRKAEVLRSYLRHWAFEVGAFFEGTGPDASDDELRRIAPKHPAFRLE
jgi:deazaflavin-dependent oxidoreductase (nitroreductase family)